MSDNNDCINAMALENYSVTWIESPESVKNRKLAGQYTAVSRQVKGSSNYVTWFTFEPNQMITTGWQEEFFAYQSSTAISSGVTITGFNSASVELGNWYQFSDDSNSWTQMSAPPEGQTQASVDSIGLYYHVPSGKSQSTTFGLQCKVSSSQDATAICADTIFSNQPVTYTPLTTLYASMGKTYETNTVIASIGNWDTLKFPGTTASVLFNDGQSRWQLSTAAFADIASTDVSNIQLLFLRAHANLCAAHASIADCFLGGADGESSILFSQNVQRLYAGEVYVSSQNGLMVIVNAQDGQGSFSYKDATYFIKNGGSMDFTLQFGEKLHNNGDSVLTLFIQ